MVFVSGLERNSSLRGVNEMSEIIEVRRSAGCFVWVNGEFLVLFREKDDTWGIPGGKVEENERYEEAAARELREETGIWKMSHHVFRDLGAHEVYDCSGLKWRYAVFELRFPTCPEIKLEQGKHSEFRWVTPQQLVFDERNDIPVFPGLTELLFKVGYVFRDE